MTANKLTDERLKILEDMDLSVVMLDGQLANVAQDMAQEIIASREVIDKVLRLLNIIYDNFILSDNTKAELDGVVSAIQKLKGA